MKKILFLTAFFIASMASNAVTHTVSNAAYLPAQFSSIQDAHDAATSGDTLLVSGTGMSYGNLMMTKQLFIIGASSSAANLSAQFDLFRIMGSACDASLFESLRIGTVQFNEVGTDVYYNALVLRRCYLGTIYLGADNNYCTNWLIEGCVFTSSGGVWNMNAANDHMLFLNFTMRNNVFNGTLRNLKYSIITNNIFVGTNANQSGWEACSTDTFTNNIIYGDRSNGGAEACTFNNNITFGGTDNTFNIPANSINYPFNIASDNLYSTDPLFVNAPVGNEFNYNFDYHLQPGSVALTAGLGGIPCGIYNDNYTFRMDGEPTIPVVRTVTIPGGNTVPAEGSFQINVTSVSHP